MKTLHAVLLSTGLVVAVGGVVAYAAYAYTAELRGRMHDAVSAAPPKKADPAAQALSERAAEELLASLRPRLAASERPVRHIALTPMAQDQLKASKVGGRAYWAAGRDYPRDPGGRPLVLLAQVDLAEARLDGAPQQGLLQFFISDSGDYYGANFDDPKHDGMDALRQARGFRVVHWPDASAPAVAPPARPGGEQRLPFEPDQPRRMRFIAERESLGSNDSGWPAAIGESLDERVEAYVRAHPEQDSDALTDALFERLSRSGHKFGGHPDFTQSDPREAGDRQVLLLQLDSDEVMMWGDSGIANFFIDPDDLKRGEFGRVAYHWDCY
ncbi:DUF1963 domain-containing protein [Lysobacter sp. Root983]|uniref:YwqG family protein n=1 Tax=Lysobacter sp. Root983 TaxID=1736613 RepID=UPI00070D82D5|nr:DUF1963 domain-containing protein [Lysobacter sp. Root983]KRD74730.1 hypothetical protein ASE43_16075 [Lysobacter sp. Root983]